MSLEARGQRRLARSIRPSHEILFQAVKVEFGDLADDLDAIGAPITAVVFHRLLSSEVRGPCLSLSCHILLSLVLSVELL